MDERVTDDLDPAITPELHRTWRNPRRGTSHPERMDNPVWDWLIRSASGSFHLNQRMGGPASCTAGPCWSWERFGRTTTTLPDGRQVFIAGEHEDSYDPDFYIYNDVVVQDARGGLEIYAYPEDAFPPTDFHSATRVGDQIVLVGSLGYPSARRPGETQVLSLDTTTWLMREMPTAGEGPGWIHGHRASLTPDARAIDIRGGQVDPGLDDRALVENVEDWRLHLVDGRWERLTRRNWPRWDLHRASRSLNLLFEMRQALWNKDMGLPLYGEFSRLLDERGEAAASAGEDALCFDASVLNSLYVPPLSHEVVPSVEGEYGVHRIRVDGVVVRYVEDMDSVTLTVEGDLPAETVALLVEDLRAKLARLEDTPYTAMQRG